MNTLLKALTEYLENENEDVKVTIEVASKKRKEKSKLTLLLQGKILNGRESDVNIQVNVVSHTPSQTPKTRKDAIISSLKERSDSREGKR